MMMRRCLVVMMIMLCHKDVWHKDVLKKELNNYNYDDTEDWRCLFDFIKCRIVTTDGNCDVINILLII